MSNFLITLPNYDAADCRRTLDKKLPEFREYNSGGEVIMGTPRLGQYYRARENFREFLDIS